MTDPLSATPAPARRSSRQRSRRRLLAAAAALVALTVVGVIVAGRGSSATGGYRTATAEVQAVDQVLDRVATVEPVAQASIAFPVAGTVATVDVVAGDQVTTGQVLATLDTASLEATLVEKRAALAAAELTLEQALAGEDVGVTSGGLSTGGSAAPAALPASGALVVVPATYVSGSSASSASVVPASAVSTDDELAVAQQAVLDAQHQVSVDMATAQQALDDAATVCAGVTDGSGSDGTADTADTGATGETTTSTTTATGETTTSTTTATGETTTSTTTATGDAGVTACRDALDAVLTAQTTVATNQTALLEAADGLDALLDERASAWASTDTSAGESAGSDGTTDAPATGDDAPADTAAPSTSGGASGDASTSGGGASTSGQGQASGGVSASSSPSSEELIAYQKAVDAAAAEVTVATQAVAQTTIVSPIAGTVQAVDLAVGDSVTAGSATAAIVVVGDGGYEVTTTVTVDDLSTVAIGQPVEVEPDGGDDVVAGEVVAVGVAGTASGSTMTYPVTIGLTEDAEGLRNGATAAVSITTDAVGDALAVPTSAVTSDGGRYTVTVVDGGTAEDVAVEVGAIGDVWTEITDGLDEGQEVALADLDEPLPSSATDGSSTATGGSGFPGGGFPGGGRPGA